MPRSTRCWRGLTVMATVHFKWLSSWIGSLDRPEVIFWFVDQQVTIWRKWEKNDPKHKKIRFCHGKGMKRVSIRLLPTPQRPCFTCVLLTPSQHQKIENPLLCPEKVRIFAENANKFDLGKNFGGQVARGLWISFFVNCCHFPFPEK